MTAYIGPSLNFPDFQFRIDDGVDKRKIFDVIRKQFVALTPEEWVRQHMIHYLLYTKGYPKGLIKVEGGHTYNNLRKRSDILVFNSKLQASVLIECKAPEVKLNDETIKQLGAYNAMYRADILCATNGLSHYVFEINYKKNRINPLKDIPVYKNTGQ